MYEAALSFRWIYSVFASSGHPDTIWSIVSSYLLHILHRGLQPSLIMLAWYNLVARLWSWDAIMNPSVSDFNPLLLSHWLVLWWSTSASFILFGYLPWRRLSSHCFVSFSWVLFRAICLVLFAYLMVVSSARLSGIVRSSSRLNCSACLCIEYNFFLPSCSCTSLIRASSVFFTYVSSPIVVVL